MEISRIITFSGHRCHKLPFGYQLNNPFELAVKKKLTEIILSLDPKPTKAILGGAQGFDNWALEVCLELKIPSVAYIPFRCFASRWPADKQKNWYELLAKCQEVKYVCDGGYEIWKLQKRNEAMSDDSDLAIVLLDPEIGGGTANFVDYREIQKKKMIFINPKDISY